jgi:hypothetical protein
MFEKALHIHRSRAMLRDEFQAAQMSLFRDRPPCSRRRAAEFLEGVKKEISVAHVTLSKRCVMNSWRRASTGFTGFFPKLR